MTTFALELAVSVNDRWKEIELLTELAQRNSSHEALYNALCRSATVLMIAHFEGFIKSCVRAVIEDANTLAMFAELPNAMKRTHCSKLVKGIDEQDSKHLNQRILKLIGIFDQSGAKMDDSHFLVLNQYDNDQNNPSPDLIQKICLNFGVEAFFERINESDLDIVFVDEKTGVEELNSRLFEHLREGLKDYPYKVESSLFNIKTLSSKCKTRTFWQTFLDEINRQRHMIAHGTSMDNSSSPDEILKSRRKLQILQYAFILMLCENSVSKISPADS